MNDKQLTFIIKTSFDCNLACSYCYEGDRTKGQRMTLETVDNLIEKAGEYALSQDCIISFIWHGGEPLLMGKEFYEHVVEKQKELGSSFHYRNLMQSNGVLLDDEIADFIKKNDFKVGISIDGPRVIHDAQRSLRNGQPSFDQAYAALVKLDDRGIQGGVLSVFTRNTLDHLDEFYDFFYDRHLSVCINTLIFSGYAADPITEKLHVSLEEFGKAMCHLWDRWVNEKEDHFDIEPLSDIVESLVTGHNRSCRFSGRCHEYFEVYPTGGIKLCGDLRPDSPFLGNINMDDMRSMMNSPAREAYRLIKAAVKETCSDCRHFNICHGGCTKSAYLQRKNLSDADYYCEAFKMIFDHVKADTQNRLPSNMRFLLHDIN